MNVTITGFDKLQRELNELERAMAALDGTITELKIDPNNPISIQNAIRQMEIAVDEKAAPYSHNRMVSKIVQAAKEHYRTQILKLPDQKKHEV